MAGATAAVDDGLHKAISYEADREESTTTPWNVDRIISYLVMAAAAGEAISELQYSGGTGNKSKHKATLLARWINGKS